MPDEIIVAVFETPDRAGAAVAELRAAGISEGAIRRRVYVSPPERPGHKSGFWSKLFGGEAGGSGDLGDEQLGAGATVVTVRVIAPQAAGIVEILDNHGPIDLDEKVVVDGYVESTDAPADTQVGGVVGKIPLRDQGFSPGSIPAGRVVRRFVADTRG